MSPPASPCLPDQGGGLKGIIVNLVECDAIFMKATMQSSVGACIVLCPKFGGTKELKSFGIYHEQYTTRGKLYEEN